MPLVRFDKGIEVDVSGPVKVIENLDGSTVIDLRQSRPVRVTPAHSYEKLPGLGVTSIEVDEQEGILSYRNPDMPIGLFDRITQKIKIGKKGKVRVLLPTNPD